MEVGIKPQEIFKNPWCIIKKKITYNINKCWCYGCEWGAEAEKLYLTCLQTFERLSTDIAWMLLMFDIETTYGLSLGKPIVSVEVLSSESKFETTIKTHVICAYLIIIIIINNYGAQITRTTFLVVIIWEFFVTSSIDLMFKQRNSRLIIFNILNMLILYRTCSSDFKFTLMWNGQKQWK